MYRCMTHPLVIPLSTSISQVQNLTIIKSTMVKAFIKGWKKVQQTDQESKHSYTVYLIEVNNNGICHTVSRRYSEFDDLNKVLKKWVTMKLGLPF